MNPEEIREALNAGKRQAGWLRTLEEAARAYADLLENGQIITETVETIEIEASEEWEFDELPLRALVGELERRGYLVVPVQEENA